MTELVGRASRSLRRRWSHARSNAHLRRLDREVAAAVAAVDAAAAEIGRHGDTETRRRGDTETRRRGDAETGRRGDREMRRRGDAKDAGAEQALLSGERPVVFFNASTRLSGLSLNAAYNRIAEWAVRLAGVPVVSFACQSGMTPCVLGTNRDRPQDPPPCAECIAQSRAVYAHTDTRWFVYQDYPELNQALEGLNVDQLAAFEYEGVPLGSLALPSMRWILRRHHLVDDAGTRSLFGQYIRSAYGIRCQFATLLDEVEPQAVVVFNGMFYPEATARWVARQLTASRREVRVISHEVGLRPFTAYFTPGDATAYPIHIPEDFALNTEQNLLLDAYLEKRMQGNFSMAGVRFWPEMRGLDETFLQRAAQFKQIVPVFTNVIFDTSQPHSNVVFPHMFAWLERVADLAREHADTLFVIRAHPDETRPGKESRESVADWVKGSRVCDLPNVLFVAPEEYFSSYELIQRAKFVMVYNSTIGLEAALMGAAVLCGGKARFTQIPTVFFPQTEAEYVRQARDFLAAEKIDVPEVFRNNARRFLYYQLYRTSLPFSEFIEEDGIWQGYVRIKDLSYSGFDPQNSPVLKVVVNGILHGEEFLI
jgi:hypothetical protein